MCALARARVCVSAGVHTIECDGAGTRFLKGSAISHERNLAPIDVWGQFLSRSSELEKCDRANRNLQMLLGASWMPYIIRGREEKTMIKVLLTSNFGFLFSFASERSAKPPRRAIYRKEPT